MKNQVQEYLKGWIPQKIIFDNQDILFKWLYTGNQPFTDPFFDSTISKCLRFTENSKRHKCVCSPDMLVEWALQTDHIEPAAFIFHVSRCGSTLVSQALGMNEEHISLSEVPVFDEILRLGFKNDLYDDLITGNLLKAATRFYGSKRTGKEKKLFIKADSWHLMFYSQLRRLYPDTPFIIMYRNASDVLHSNQHQKGMQACYDVLEPELFGLQNIPDEQKHPEMYMPMVLEKYFEAIVKIHRSDRRTVLLNYNQGLSAQMEEIASFTGIRLDAEYKEAINNRNRFHAKHPGERFEERIQLTTIDETRLYELDALYEEIDSLRLKDQLIRSANYERQL